jgi:hypothetical protein
MFLAPERGIGFGLKGFSDEVLASIDFVFEKISPNTQQLSPNIQY